MRFCYKLTAIGYTLSVNKQRSYEQNNTVIAPDGHLRIMTKKI